MTKSRQEIIRRQNARIADRYIERDGSEPDLPPNASVAAMVRRDSQIDKITIVASFIAWHDSDDMYGGHRAHEALKAFSDLLRIPVVSLKNIAAGEGR